MRSVRAMGFLARKQNETAELLRAQIDPLVGDDEDLRGCVYATRPGRMSVRLYSIGVTDRRLILREVDRKWRPTPDPPISLTHDEVTVGNIFSEGARWALGDKDLEIRFSGGGEDYRLTVLGGTLIENALAGSAQLTGLDALIEFLRAAGT